MTAMNRFKRMFTGANRMTGDSLFQSYYGSVISQGQDGGPSAEEARRDFARIREAVSRISVY